ncbi:MAG: hypothetical protein JWN48_3130, partial [Myxococcaceae bacterium]|nr:hypothetical protein [Myxococcaceae bacterium]
MHTTFENTPWFNAYKGFLLLQLSRVTQRNHSLKLSVA